VRERSGLNLHVEDRLPCEAVRYDARMKRILVSWSSGKDSAWALHLLRQRADCEIVGLLTTVNSEFDRVAMHGTRRSVLEAQAEAAGLPSSGAALFFSPSMWSSPATGRGLSACLSDRLGFPRYAPRGAAGRTNSGGEFYLRPASASR